MKYLGLDLKHILSDKIKVLSGVGDGEKIILAQNFDHLLFLSNNFVSAGKLKRGLQAFGKKVEIVYNARDGKDENDKNLIPFVESINKYILKEVDALIFLPCSAIIKFDLEKFKPLQIIKGDILSLTEITNKLIEYGYERTSLVDMPGQFALRGDILDIFTTSNEYPIRIEFFDDLVENISLFDQSTMKNIQKLDKINITLSKLPLGDNDIFDLEGFKFLDEPKKIDEEISMLKQSYKTMSFYKDEYYQDFETLYEKADLIFDNFQIANPQYNNQKVAERSYLTDFLALKQDILDFKNLHQAILLFAGEERFKKNLQNFLNENGLSWFDYNENEKMEIGNIYLSSYAMPYSFSFLKEGVVAIGCDNLFRTSSTSFSKSKHSVFYLPKLGDYVVHTFHGIGKCVRIERLKISDIEKDYFVIEYKNGGIKKHRRRRRHRRQFYKMG